MNHPTFLEGVGVALVASALTSIGYAILASSFPANTALVSVMMLLSLGYLTYLLARTPERVGRISAAAFSLVVLGIGMLLNLPIIELALVQLGLIWLIRSLFFYSSFLAVLVDLTLSGLSSITAIWAMSQSGSLLLTVWCLMLVQALFVFIPPSLARAGCRTTQTAAASDSFLRAQRTAESALRNRGLSS